MLEDLNVERHVKNAIKPLRKEIAKLKVQIEELNKALRIHDVSGQVCVHCGKGRDMHTVASAMCLDRMKHFEKNLR